MPRFFNSLLFRTAALSLAGLAALQLAIFLVALWPDGRPVMGRLLGPADIREIAEAIERAPVQSRQDIAAALSNEATTVKLHAAANRDLAGRDLRPAPRLEPRFRLYAEALEGRDLQVQVRDEGLLGGAIGEDGFPRGPIRLSIALRSGEVLTIERAPLLLHLLASRYIVIALVAALILSLLTAMLYWQVVRPIARLAHATEEFRDNMAAPDVPLTGAREVRLLAEAFNAMKARLTGLMAERTRVLAAIAHDLRTYLTRLRLRAEHIADERQRSRAVMDIEEMGQLLSDILLFAQGESDRGNGVADIGAEAMAYAEMRRETGDRVDIEVRGEGLLARCSALAVRRILGNLVDNAVRYGERARISVWRDEEAISLMVGDDGPGVPGEWLDRIADPFERLEQSRSRNSGGAGLGLAIVKGLAESYGGSLVLRNGKDGGLIALVSLPAA